MSEIPFYDQYHYEVNRNNKFGWLLFGLAVASLVVYGLVHFHLQRYFRLRKASKIYFNFLNWWQLFNSRLKIPFTNSYFTPSLIVLLTAYLAVNAAFAVAQTLDLNYEPQYYIVGKRIGKLAVHNFLVLNLFVTKNNLVGYVTGIPHDQIIFLHRWIGRIIWLMVIAHFSLSICYWTNIGFPQMLVIPPEIFGMIAFGSMTILIWASPRALRRISYEFFLFNHGLFSGIMFLMIIFHNSSAKTPAIIAVHIVVLDRVWSRVKMFVGRYISPTKCIAEITLVDDTTLEVLIPTCQRPKNKFVRFFSPLTSWNAGQHVYVNFGKIRKLQWHPFTIASAPGSDKIKLIIKKRSGVTRAIVKDLEKEENGYKQMKAMVHGPYGAHLQPLITFKTVVFIAGGSGGSFVFPVALDLIRKIKERRYEENLNIPEIKLYWYIRRRENCKWYESELNELQDNSFVSVYCCVTRQPEEPEETGISEEAQVSFTDTPLFEVEEQKSSRTTIASEKHNGYTVSIHEEKPHVRDIINNAVDDSPGPVAVLGCGPEVLGNDIEAACQSNRWRTNADIYSYVEKYH